MNVKKSFEKLCSYLNEKEKIKTNGASAKVQEMLEYNFRFYYQLTYKEVDDEKSENKIDDRVMDAIGVMIPKIYGTNSEYSELFYHFDFLIDSEIPSLKLSNKKIP